MQVAITSGSQRKVLQASEETKCFNIADSWLYDVLFTSKICVIPVERTPDTNNKKIIVVNTNSLEEVAEKIARLITHQVIHLRYVSVEKIATLLTRDKNIDTEKAMTVITRLFERLGIRLKKWAVLSPPEISNTIPIGLSMDKDDALVVIGDRPTAIVMVFENRHDAERARKVLIYLDSLAINKQREKDLVEKLGRRDARKVIEIVGELLRRHYYNLKNRLVYISTIGFEERVDSDKMTSISGDSIHPSVYLRHGKLGLRIGPYRYEEEIPRHIYNQLKEEDGFMILYGYIANHPIFIAMDFYAEKAKNNNILLLIPISKLPKPFIPSIIEKTMIFGGRRVAVFRAKELASLCDSIAAKIVGPVSFKAIALQGDMAFPVTIYIEPFVKTFFKKCNILITGNVLGEKTMEKTEAMPA